MGEFKLPRGNKKTPNRSPQQYLLERLSRRPQNINTIGKNMVSSRKPPHPV